MNGIGERGWEGGIGGKRCERAGKGKGIRGRG